MAATLSSPQVEITSTRRSVTLPNKWAITSETHPISNAAELDALQEILNFALPEMTFGNNVMRLKHLPSGWEYVFDTENALKAVKNGPLGEGDGGVKVGHAAAWMSSRTDPSTKLPLPETVATKPFDWTYTTTYPGHSSSTTAQFKPADPNNPAHAIPMAELTRPDPITLYAETLLFEDELHDNGSSSLTIRVRVMPGCWFLLSRFSLRVDSVLFRTFDTRLFHSFASDPPLVIRETAGWEAPYDVVKRSLYKPNDLSPLADPNYIAAFLSKIPPDAAAKGAGTVWRGIGKRVEVAQLSNEDLSSKLDDLHL